MLTPVAGQVCWSPDVSYIFYAAGFPSKEMDPSHVIAILDQSEPNPRRRAALVWLLCAVQPGDRGAKIRWLNGASVAIEGQLNHDVIATWLRKLGQVERAAH
jgi:hypothetical protein